MNNSYYDRKIKDLENKIKCKTRFYNTFSDFPEVGVECALFVDESTGDIYIWNGTEYILNGAGEGAQGIQGTVGIQGVQGISIQGIQGRQGTQGLSGTSSFSYGSFYDTTDQSVTSGQVAPMQYNTNDFASGVSILNDTNADPTIIKLTNAGKYNIQFSAQLYRESGGSAAHVDIWLRKNGTNSPDSSTKIHLANNNTYVVAAWNFLVSAAAGDEYQLMWSQDASVILAHEAEDLVTPHPAIPSVILTITQVA
jgi:hypothetical protein